MYISGAACLSIIRRPMMKGLYVYKVFFAFCWSFHSYSLVRVVSKGCHMRQHRRRDRNIFKQRSCTSGKPHRRYYFLYNLNAKGNRESQYDANLRDVHRYKGSSFTIWRMRWLLLRSRFLVGVQFYFEHDPVQRPNTVWKLVWAEATWSAPPAFDHCVRAVVVRDRANVNSIIQICSPYMQMRTSARDYPTSLSVLSCKRRHPLTAW